MASSDPEIKDGLTLPVWMKSKPAKDYELFAASPPAPEDSFFYIRYPKSDLLFGKKAEPEPKIQVESKDLSSAVYNGRERDWSRHTKPCQEVLHGIAPINTAVNPATKPKPAGVDDGFKGEGAACGNSIVKVAHQMMSSSRSPRGFTVVAPEEDAQAPEPHQYNLAARRGSKSLPVTPAHSPSSSPTSRRKKNGNRYFTSPFEPAEEAAAGRGWLATALLGLKKDLAASSATLAEEDDHVEHRLGGGSLAQSVESLGPAPRGRDPKLLSSEAPLPQPKSAMPSQAYRPKPSELREMNFWSPTSM